MPSDPSGERYSLEEMLDRVKGENSTAEPSDNEERQVLEDGTVRVRKRKRRSTQPVYAKRRRNKLLALVGLLAGLLLLGLLALTLLRAGSHYAKEGFSRALAASIKETSGLQADLGKVSVQDGTALCESLEFSELGEGPFTSVALKGLSGEVGLGERLSRKWNFNPIKVESAVFHLRSSVGDGPVVVNSQDDQVGHEVVLGGGDGLESVRFRRIEIEKADFHWRNGRETIMGTRCFLSHRSDREWAVHLEGGKVKIDGWPEFDLNFANLKVSPDRIEFEMARLGVPAADSAIRLSGAIERTAGPDSVIDLKIEGLPTSAVLEEQWLASLPGLLHGDLRFSPFGVTGQRTVVGLLSLDNGKPEDMAFWKMLPSEVRDLPALTAGKVRQATAELFWSEERVAIRDLRMGRESLVSFRGHFGWERANPQDCQGQIEMGLPPVVIEAFPKGRPPFVGESTQIEWIPIQIRGTLDQPLEDFGAKISNYLRQGSPR